MGSSNLPGDTATHAFLYSGGVMSDLGTLDGIYSTASGINNSGQVVGTSYLLGDKASRAFLYSGGVMSDLGTLGGSSSAALGINNFGQVVGWSFLSDDAVVHAFLYSGGVMSDLSNLFPTGTGWSIDAAYDIPFSINDSGQIAGIGTINGEQHAFILTPESAPVPEPSTFVFLCIGLGMLGYLRKKMNKV